MKNYRSGSSRGFGSFGLQGNQREPLTLFVPMRILQKKMFRSFDEEAGSTEFANFILLGNPERTGLSCQEPKNERKMDLGGCWDILQKTQTFDLLERADSAGIPFRRHPERRPQNDPKAQGVLTYLVNAIERKQAVDVNGSNLIPYSMVSASPT